MTPPLLFYLRALSSLGDIVRLMRLLAAHGVVPLSGDGSQPFRAEERASRLSDFAQLWSWIFDAQLFRGVAHTVCFCFQQQL